MRIAKKYRFFRSFPADSRKNGDFFQLRLLKFRGGGDMLRIYTFSAPVAQLDRAIASGAIGREFESRRVHHFFASNQPQRKIRCQIL